VGEKFIEICHICSVKNIIHLKLIRDIKNLYYT
jgi:hypothetical protein